LQTIGKGFILLLQMTLLPYIVLSLMTGLGRLTYRQVKSLVLKAGSLLVLSWGLAIGAILLMPLAFPVSESASFFSTSLIEMPEQVNFLRLFIPSNPFFSLANNVVPAVVLFSGAVGLALIGIEQKQRLLEPLTVLSRAMGKVTGFVSKLTPLGVFGIISSAAGTMGLDELAKLQVYLWTYIAMALVLTFWVLPALVTSLSPLTYRQVVGQTRDIMVTAFATGSAIIVIPLLIERSKDLLHQANLHTEEGDATVDVIIPAFTSFPKAGTLLPMSFILFAGWFSGSTVPLTEYPTLIVTGLVSFFGGVNVAMPMLLDLMRIPVDLFQLYLALTVVTNRFGVLLTTMNILMLTLLGTCAVCGVLTPRWGTLLRNMVLTLLIMAVTIGSARTFFTLVLDNEYSKDKVITSMQLLRQPGPATIHKTPPPVPAGDSSLSALARIGARGVIRVGYLPDNLPFAYFNGTGDLVGFDIDMAYALARDLDVKLEFVPMARGEMAAQLNSGYSDIVMAGVAVTPRRAQAMAFSIPYVELTVAFITKDYRREDFNSREAIKGLKAPRIGVPNLPYYIDKVKRYLPQAELVVLNSITEFFEQHGDDLDAFVYSAEAGSAWSLLYPDYTVAIPQPDVLSAPLAYPTAQRNQGLVDFINIWIALKQKDRTIQSLYDYWILGKNAVAKQPRWSVIRNVLHWVE
ncbi:MAG: cation:dicarboxylase symporter family transporter, partial [bacterium]|nr:cation:dicarboxylase symporter family transporter [bacterium]